MKKCKVTSEHPHLKSGLILEYYKESEKDDGYNLEGTNRPYYSCLDIANWLKEGFIEEIKKVYEVGKYYKDSGYPSWIIEIDENGIAKGFTVTGAWFAGEGSIIGNTLSDTTTEATEQEFKDRLLQYAKENYTEGVVFKAPETEIQYLSNNQFNFHGTDLYCNSLRVYSKGQWAEIIKKPICKLGDGSFLYDGDLEKGKVYVIHTDYEWIVKVEDVEKQNVITVSSINVKGKYHVSGGYFSMNNIKFIKPATKKQIKHLERCEKAEKYVPRKEKKKYTDSDMIEFHKFSTAESTEYAKKDLKYWKKMKRKND